MARGEFKIDTVFMKAGIKNLEAIQQLDEPGINDIAEHRGRSYANTSNYLSKMEDEGYISKEEISSGSSNAPQKIIRLTEKGEAVLEVMNK